MAKIGYSSANRSRGARRLLRWSLLALAGVGSGILLGELAAGGRAKGLHDALPSYSRLSANPDAMVPQGEAAPPCLACPDSYGISARLRAQRSDRMSDEFRELGAVGVDLPAPSAAEADYRYGGRFPDPDPQNLRTAQPVEPVTAEQPADSIPSTGEVLAPLPAASE